MTKIVWFLLLSFSLRGWTQATRPSVDYVSQIVSNLTTPVYVDINGNVKLSLSSNDTITFPFLAQVGLYTLNVSVNAPFEGRFLDQFVEADSLAKKIITRRRSFEIGVGMGIIQSSFIDYFSVGAGLIPYAGGFWEAINMPSSQLSKGEFWNIPVKQDLWERWGVGESRTYQVYGGLSVYVGANISVITLLRYVHTIQGRYDVSLKKLDDRYAMLKVRREGWDKDSLQTGSPIHTLQFDHVRFWDRERFFVVDMHDEDHRKALANVWRGNLVPLQKLDVELVSDKKSFWFGTQKIAYVGIPWIVGKIFSEAKLKKVASSENENYLWMFSYYNTNTGLLAQARTKRSILTFEPDANRFNALISFERNKTTAKTIHKEVFSFIEQLSNQKLDFGVSKEKLGYSMSTISLNFTTKQMNLWLDSVRDLNPDRYKMICTIRLLECAKNKRAYLRIKRIKKLALKVINTNKKELKEKLMITFTAYLFRRPALWSEILSLSDDRLDINLLYWGSHFYPYQKQFMVPTEAPLRFIP